MRATPRPHRDRSTFRQAVVVDRLRVLVRGLRESTGVSFQPAQIARSGSLLRAPTADMCALRRDRLHVPPRFGVIVRSNPEANREGDTPRQRPATGIIQVRPNRGRERRTAVASLTWGNSSGGLGYVQEVAQRCHRHGHRRRQLRDGTSLGRWRCVVRRLDGVGRGPRTDR